MVGFHSAAGINEWPNVVGSMLNFSLGSFVCVHCMAPPSSQPTILRSNHKASEAIPGWERSRDQNRRAITLSPDISCPASHGTAYHPP